MPTQDTWSSIAALKKSSYNGRIRTWVNTPNFGSLPKGTKPVNRYDDHVLKYSQTDYYTKSTDLNTGVVSYSYPPGPLFTGNGLDTIVYTSVADYRHLDDAAANENSAMVKALGKISDAKTNISVALAEASKTSDMIFDTAKRIDRAYRAFRRGNLKAVAEALNITPKTVHKTWLGYKYGWMPLLMDVKNTAEFFAQQHMGRPVRFTVSASQESDRTTVHLINFTPFGIPPPDVATRTITSKGKAKVKIWCELTNSHYSALQQLGVTNPALVAWELVPYSFVFDWFYSVGDWLQALSALDGISIKRKWLTSYLDTTVTQVGPYNQRISGSTMYEESAYTLNLNRKLFVRVDPTVDPLSLSVPKNKGLDFTKLLTSLALIRGSYRGPYRL